LGRMLLLLIRSVNAFL